MARPWQSKQTARLNVSFDKEVYERVMALADAHDASTAWIVRRAVNAYLEDHRHNPQIINVRRSVQSRTE